ncbi:hypothetical protein EMMF5_001653 [Cystobasidiomycetes sp. EMM_F5]
MLPLTNAGSAISQLLGWTSTIVREEYRRRHAGHDSSVRGNDVAFAVHALTIASVTLAQTVLYKVGINGRDLIVAAE